MGVNLHELSLEYRKLADIMDSAEVGEDGTVLVGEEFEKALNDMTDALEVKVQNCQIMALHWDAEAAAIAEEEKRLAKRRTVLNNKSARMEKYVLEALILAKLSSLKTRLFSFRVNKPKFSVEVYDVKALPEELLRRPEPEGKKKEIKALIDAGKSVPGARLIPGKSSLTVL